MVKLKNWCIILGLSIQGLSLNAEVQYNQDIRPILSDKCFHCHGFDEKTREAKLRLDLPEEAFKVKKGVAAIVPGNPNKSEVLARILTDDPDDVMPPPDSHKAKLTKKEIDLITQWIKEGAKYQGHWAFTSPKKEELPKTSSTNQLSHAIDHFVEDELNSKNLKLSPEADKATLLRRLSFDLTGLPPSLKELESFLKDTSPQAYEKAVDLLLANKHYGEHMGRFWLDAARYGDTHGLHLDNFRMMWPYRDWVIDAFNDNKSFKAFSIEQLAGDLIPDSNQQQKIASGFNRCNVTTSEGGSIDEEFYVRYAVDRANTTGTVWLGLSVGCAQCHDHKYDPITQKEYYQMYAYFNNITERAMDGNKQEVPPIIKVITKKAQIEIDTFNKEKSELNKTYQASKSKMDADLLKWIDTNKVDTEKAMIKFEAWNHIGPFTASNSRKAFDQAFGPEKDRKLLKELYSKSYQKQKWKIEKGYTDGKVHHLDPKANSAQYLLRNIYVSKDTTQNLSLGSDDAIKVWQNGEELFSKYIGRGAKADQEKLTLNLKKGDNHILIKIVNFSGPSGFYFNLRDSGLPANIASLIQIGFNNCNQNQKNELRKYYESKVWPVSLKHQKDSRAIDQKIKGLQSKFPSTLVMQERMKPRGAYILERGEYDRRQEPVQPGTPAFLPEIGKESKNNRLGFAKWLMRKDHPLVSRVTVNRFWQQIFGIGLVETSEDFGTQGAFPSHPQLLDWLAVDFMEHDWDIKRLIKGIVMSKTYRQSSNMTPHLLKIDPNNRLLSRGPRFRLDAEMIRDQALSASGLLVKTMGGPSVKPYQPKGIWYAVGYTSSNTSRFKKDAGDKLYRRSVYTFWKRTAPPPGMSIFDAPSRENCSVRRERTNTPLQALNLMNDVQYIEAAIHFATRVLKEGGKTNEDKFQYAFKVLLNRNAKSNELKILNTTLENYLTDFEKNNADAQQLLQHGDKKSNINTDNKTLAAWTMIANILLNLDETINKG